MLGRRAGGERGDREWDGWMASLTQWTQVWVISGSWWCTGKSGLLQSMGSQRLGHDRVTELNWRVDKAVEKRQILHHWWKHILVQSYKALGVPWRLKNRTAIVSSNSTSGYTVLALSVWDIFQDPQWMSETKNSTKLSIYNIFPIQTYLKKI